MRARALQRHDHIRGQRPAALHHTFSQLGVDFEVFSTAVLHNEKGHLLGDGWSILTDSHILTSEHPLRHGSAVLTPDDRLTWGVRPRKLTCNDKRIVISDVFDKNDQTFKRMANCFSIKEK